MEKKALDMFLDGWCKDCATDYSECAILGICKASIDTDEDVCPILSYNKGGEDDD